MVIRSHRNTWMRSTNMVFERCSLHHCEDAQGWGTLNNRRWEKRLRSGWKTKQNPRSLVSQSLEDWHQLMQTCGFINQVDDINSFIALLRWYLFIIKFTHWSLEFNEFLLCICSHANTSRLVLFPLISDAVYLYFFSFFSTSLARYSPLLLIISRNQLLASHSLLFLCFLVYWLVVLSYFLIFTYFGFNSLTLLLVSYVVN